MERIEPRPAGFVEDYFTVPELALVEQTPAALRDVLITAIWSGKEAALKALHLGLTVDTRAVICLIEPERPEGWTPFTIILYPVRRNGFSRLPSLVGYWRVMGDFVLAVAVQTIPGLNG